jgi:hypothetical protein
VILQLLKLLLLLLQHGHIPASMDVDLGICFDTCSYFTDDDQASLEWSWLLATRYLDYR